MAICCCVSPCALGVDDLVARVAQGADHAVGLGNAPFGRVLDLGNADHDFGTVDLSSPLGGPLGSPLGIAARGHGQEGQHHCQHYAQSLDVPHLFVLLFYFLQRCGRKFPQWPATNASAAPAMPFSSRPYFSTRLSYVPDSVKTSRMPSMRTGVGRRPESASHTAPPRPP